MNIKDKHNAWVYSISRAAQQPYAAVEHQFAFLEKRKFNTEEYIHNTVTYLYKVACMPILLYTSETIGIVPAISNIIYTQQSIRIVIGTKIHIRIVTIDIEGTMTQYPFYCLQNNDIQDLNFSTPGSPEETMLRQAPIHAVIIIGM